jgi:16S rRNA (cytosine967-C5)-methyltransferase
VTDLTGRNRPTRDASRRPASRPRTAKPDPNLPQDPPRRAAYDTLLAVETNDAYANLVLPGLLTAGSITGRDAALATELSYGTLRALGTLDEVIRSCSTRPLDDIEPGVLTLLRLGAYQLLRTRIPTHAAVATTVDLARATGNARSDGFVNAVLRKVAAADFDQWCERIGAGASPMGALAIRYSHPGWIVAAFADSLGIEPDEDGLVELADALAADDARPETHLVAWPGRVSREELVAQSGGRPGPYSPFAVRLEEGGEPAALEAIRERRAGVQDEGSQLCALALSRLPLSGPDERWLDICAGPGGKAALLAALAEQRGATLTANELHPHRGELIRKLTEGWPVEVVVADARTLVPDERGYDRVLLDAPCTGLGALRRRPESRWRRTTADLQELVTLQGELLTAALNLVRPGGVVGYVTCSPHLAETRDQIEALLANRADVELIDAREVFGELGDVGSGPTVQLWPHRHGTDAMFFAAVHRRVV